MPSTQLKKSQEPADVASRAVQRAIRMLAAANCRYAVIDSQGQRYGQLEVHERSRSRRQLRPYGQLRDHCRPYLTNVAVGEAVKIPLGRFTARELRSSITAWLTVNWGLSTYTSFCTDTHVEILRIA